jgi:hypothetical protein
MSLNLKFDIDSIANQFKEIALEVKNDLEKGVERLAAATNAHVHMEAEEKLSSATLQKFNKSIGFENPAPGIWVVSVDEKGLWVEEGLPSGFDMKPGLLDSPKAKTSKRGFKYTVIPFDMGKSESKATGYEWTLRNKVKSELEKAGIPFKKIETLPSGKPRTGLLHRLDLGGDVLPGASTPVLQGLSIYQTVTKTGNVRRDIMTLRTVSGDPASGSASKWFHPGREGSKFLDSAAAWAEKEWTDTILPEIMEKWKG